MRLHFTGPRPWCTISGHGPRDLLKTLPAVAVTPFFLNGMEAGATEPMVPQGIVLKPWQKRVVKDLERFRIRADELMKFIREDPDYATMSPEEQNDVKRQLLFMRTFVSMLEERVQKFE